MTAFKASPPPMTEFKDFLLQLNATLPRAHALFVLVGKEQVPLHSLLVIEIGDMVAICDERLPVEKRVFRVLSKSNIDLDVGSKYFYELESPEKKADDARTAELGGYTTFDGDDENQGQPNSWGTRVGFN